MGNRKFVPHPVGADAHIGPFGSCEFAENLVKKTGRKLQKEFFP